MDVKSVNYRYMAAQIHVYTGDGKGKTTASLGLGLRALGYGKKVAIVQFLKGRVVGEHRIEKKLGKNFVIENFGRKELILGPEEVKDVDRRASNKAMETAEKWLKRGVDVLVLDEINIATYFKMINIKDILDFIDQAKKSKSLDVLILTGRKAPKAVISKADLVTEMKEIKHPYKFGQKARKGIEY